MKKSIKEILEKIGLAYDFNQNKIFVSDEFKWEKNFYDSSGYL